MKQVLQYRRSGATRVVEVPAPLTPGGGVLVQTRWSLISPGTERMLVEAGGSNLLNTARKRPDLVKQVADKLARDGVAATVEAVRSRLDVAIPLGYSCAGTVVDVGANARAAFSRDDRVACAGAGQANHAEIVGVARNLTVRVPDAVSLDDAAFVTVGAIALQGVRIADVRLGEACVVIGLGLVGQLTVQLLKAAGCRVFGIDVAADKVELARLQGADVACLRSDPDLVEQVRAFSLGRGADAILIAAATGSSDPIQLAPSLARDRAVVVAVGMIGMDVPRNPYYEKELQVRLSRSYGPGRYDRSYEEDGVDYPVGYVRWTEQRNMEAFLDLVAAGAVHPSRLVTHRVPIADAERAYQIVTGEVAEPYLGILLEYPQRQAAEAPTQTRVEVRPARVVPSGSVRLGVIGAGSFARSVLLPALKKLDVELRGVATVSAPSAQQTASRFGFGYAATDWRQVIEDDSVDAVVIATRHDLHASVAAAALRAGKAVFLEKPMALTEDDLEDLLAAWRSSGRVLQVGFNRRFAPTFQQVKARFGWPGTAGSPGGLFAAAGPPALPGPQGESSSAGPPAPQDGSSSGSHSAPHGDARRAGERGGTRRGPLVLAYRVNAGAVAPTSWVVDPVQGGGRLVGEVCHMVDTLADLVSAPVVSVYAQAAPSAALDDVVLTLTFAEGSIGTIVYASGGDRSLPKEYLEVLGGGTAAVLDDFRTVRVHASGRTRRLSGQFPHQDKGHAAELSAFVEAVRTGQPSPVHPEDAAHVTRVTFAAVESIRTGQRVDL